jgi:Na+-transporting methylmalonyl-CoA/oxaloacetate decarboxylase gamma subunit
VRENMSLELMAIYIALGIILIIGIVIIILSILIYKVVKVQAIMPTNKQSSDMKIKQKVEVGTVFCRNCGSQFNSNEQVCPNCKTPR